MRRGSKLLVLLGALSGLFPIAPTPVGYGRGHCRALVQRVIPTTGVAVELELPWKTLIHRLTTTINGRVSGLFQGFDDAVLPPWLAAAFPEFKEDPGQVPWDFLNVDQKLELINLLPALRGNVGFGDDRKIPNLLMKRQITLTFERPTEIYGQTYPPGTHVIDVSDFMLTYVEYVAPRDMKKLIKIEFHFRADSTAGQMSSTAFGILDGLGIPRKYQHVHITAKLPRAKLTANAKLQTTRMVEFYRRINLLAEMIHIIELGRAIRDKVDDNGVQFFRALDQDRLRILIDYFMAVARGENPPIGDLVKMAWIGARGSDKYVGPEELWGVEYRAIFHEMSDETRESVLDQIQYAMAKDDYGIPDDIMKSWLRRRFFGFRVENSLADLWYNKPWEDIIKGLGGEKKQLFAQLGFAKGRDLPSYANRFELKMLAHDWSKDPLLLMFPDLRGKIESEQKDALARMVAGENFNAVMADFLINSGLHRAVLTSLNLEFVAKDKGAEAPRETKEK